MSWRSHIGDTENESNLALYKPTIVPFPGSNTLVEPDQIFINDLVLDASIGVYDFELTITQPVKFNIVLDIDQISPDEAHEKKNIVCYDTICQGIKAIVDEGHVGLVETLAERVADLCLQSRRARKVIVSVAKPNAIASAAGVGIRIVRTKIEI
jgi:dihydroneopterin aldolase